MTHFNHPHNVPATTQTLQSWCLAEPKGPGVNLWLITTRRPRLSRVICLSLHPVKETLRSLPLLRLALCPLVNPAERFGSGGGVGGVGGQSDLPRSLSLHCFCCRGQCQAPAPHVRFGCQLLAPQQTALRHLFRCCFLLISRMTCLLIFPDRSSKHANIMQQMCHFQRRPTTIWSRVLLQFISPP